MGLIRVMHDGTLEIVATRSKSVLYQYQLTEEQTNEVNSFIADSSRIAPAQTFHLVSKLNEIGVPCVVHSDYYNDDEDDFFFEEDNQLLENLMLDMHRAVSVKAFKFLSGAESFD
jgi:hypothetical protein